MKTNQVRLLLLLGIWGAAAAIAGAFHLLAHLPQPGGPLLIASLCVSFSFALWQVGWLRTAMQGFSVRAIVAAHLFRLIGVYFLWLQGQGRLPAEFAQRAGWGDVAAALGAGLLLMMKNGPMFRRTLFAWNMLGALDLLVAVGTGGWLSAVRPGSMNEIAGLPLTLVPLWAVPVLLASHFYLIRRSLSPSVAADSQPVGAF